MRKKWVQDRTGNLIPANEYVSPSAPSVGPTIVPDIQDFVSSIDGTIVRGRRGMREHCLRHDVVPTQELQGLPPLLANQPWNHSSEEREAIKRELARNIDHARRNKLPKFKFPES